MGYHASVELSAELSTEFNILHRKTHAKWLTWFRVVLSLVILSMIGMCIRLMSFGVRASYVFLLVFEIALFVYVFFIDRVNGFVTRKRIVKGHDTTEYAFNEDGIEAASGDMEQKIKYSAITDIYCRKDVLYLYIDKRHAFVIPESAVTGGTAEEFEAYISARCGKEIRKIK